VRNWNAEHRNDGVTYELLDGTAMVLEQPPHLVVVAAEDDLEGLGVQALGQRRGVHQIDEHHRDGLSDAGGRVGKNCQGPPAGKTEASVTGVRLAAVGACRHTLAEADGRDICSAYTALH
jgi:hypothetical protein